MAEENAIWLVCDPEQGRLYLVNAPNYQRAKSLVYGAQTRSVPNSERDALGLMRANRDSYICQKVEVEPLKVKEINPVWLQHL